MLLHLEFTLNFSTIFVDPFNIRASQEVFPTEVRSPEMRPSMVGNAHPTAFILYKMGKSDIDFVSNSYINNIADYKDLQISDRLNL